MQGSIPGPGIWAESNLDGKQEGHKGGGRKNVEMWEMLGETTPFQRVGFEDF